MPGDDDIPGLWDYIGSRWFGWKSAKRLTFEQRAEHWLRQMDGGTALSIFKPHNTLTRRKARILDELTVRFKAPSEALALRTQKNEDIFHQNFERWATKGQHNAEASQTWNLNSTKSFLASHIQGYRNIDISSATRIVHRAISFWSQYPMLSKERDGMNEDELLRAVGFLTGCDRSVSQNVDPTTQEPIIRWDEDIRDDEDTVRSLAVRKPSARHLAGHNPDILGILFAIKPSVDDEDDLEDSQRIFRCGI